MVIDTLDNFGKYTSLNPLFQEVADFMATHDLRTLEEGKHPIHGADLFVNVTTAKGRTSGEATLEIHRRMVDIQIPLDREETYGYTPLEDLPEADFNEEKDIAKFPGLPSQSHVTCRPGMFAIFFPQDGHAPCIGKGGIKKAIFKILA